MIRDITIGQYYPVDSPVHRLDPRVKLSGTMIFLISLFVFSGYIGYVIAAVFVGSVIKLSKVPFRYIVRGLKPVLLLLLITLLFNLLLTREGKEVFSFWIIHIYDEGIIMAALMAVRLVLLVLGTSLMTFTTTPNQLTDGLEKGLRGLKKIKIPVHEIAMMMSIALRFIPILVEETDKIMKAQQARGADFESGKLLQRAKALVPLLVPLIVSAFRRANDLALAMEARCYHGGDGRTKMKPLKYKKRDFIAYLILIGYLGLVIASGFLFK
jgi:energy-coupling factor transport system permease protein